MRDWKDGEEIGGGFQTNNNKMSCGLNRTVGEGEQLD